MWAPSSSSAPVVATFPWIEVEQERGKAETHNLKIGSWFKGKRAKVQPWKKRTRNEATTFASFWFHQTWASDTDQPYWGRHHIFWLMAGIGGLNIVFADSDVQVVPPYLTNKFVSWKARVLRPKSQSNLGTLAKAKKRPATRPQTLTAASGASTPEEIVHVVLDRRGLPQSTASSQEV